MAYETLWKVTDEFLSSAYRARLINIFRHSKAFETENVVPSGMTNDSIINEATILNVYVYARCQTNEIHTQYMYIVIQSEQNLLDIRTIPIGETIN